jgi:ABC-type Fe3+/spermidine/putrescine transport system ATPase subunit
VPEVRVEGAAKAYGAVRALQGVSLTVNAGEYLCVVGPSGCGKTTLIKTIAGIVKPDAGEVYIEGEAATALPIEERGVGYVFQEIALFPHMNSYDNVSYGLMVRGATPMERESPVEEMLYMMGLEDYATLYPMELSGGAKQKTAISRALVSGSTLLLLDEPLGALDLKVRTSLRYELRKLVKDLGLTAIHVTHDQEEALSISDRIVVMKAGRIVEVGPPQEMYLNPRELFTAKFLGEANFFTGTVKTCIDCVAEVAINGSTLMAATREETTPKAGERCVLAIRPEFIELVNDPAGENTWECTVKSASFIGDHFRYELMASNGEVFLSKAAVRGDAAGFAAGDKVYAALPEDRLLIFRYPDEGLEKTLSLERG